MLELAEKIVAGVCGVLVIATAGIYLFVLGVPTTISAEFVPRVKKVPTTVPTESSKNVEQDVPTDEKDLLDKLALQQRKLLPGQRLPRDTYVVPEKTLEVVSTEANWLRELKMVGSRPIGVGQKTTRLEIFDIQENSVLTKLGFQENDVIELIDGQIVEFSDKNATVYHGLLKSAVKKLRQGQPISVTLTRKNQLQHFEFKL